MVESHDDFLTPSPADPAPKPGKPEPSVKVTVADWTQIGHEGEVHRGGETFSAPASLAATWIEAGWATAATKPGKARPAAKEPAPFA